MSDLLAAAAQALDVPQPLVQRSAAARADANGTTIEEVLTAWAGGSAPTPVSAPTPNVESSPPDSPQPPPAPAAAPPPAAPPPIEPAPLAPAPPRPVAPPMPEAEPVPLGRRLRVAVRSGVWTGAALGLFAFLLASMWWAPSAGVVGEGPYDLTVAVSSTALVAGVAAVGLVFGSITAGLSRTVAAWVDRGMRLATSPAATTRLGAITGALFGAAAGAVLAGSGSPIEGVEGVVQLPVLGTLVLAMIGGGLLGAATAAITQAVAVPAAVEDGEEVEMMRRRLGSAIGVPTAGVLLLVILVLPFALALIRSNHLTPGGASIVAILTAVGILGFASLAGTRPNVRISLSEVLVALVGIGTVLVVILAVLNARAPADEHTEEPAEHAAVSLRLG